MAIGLHHRGMFTRPTDQLTQDVYPHRPTFQDEERMKFQQIIKLFQHFDPANSEIVAIKTRFLHNVFATVISLVISLVISKKINKIP